MRRLISGILVAALLLALSLPVTAVEGNSLTRVFRWDYEDGSIGSDLYRKGANSASVKMDDVGTNHFLALEMDNPISADMYYQLQANKLTTDYLTDAAAGTQMDYYNATSFVVSLSVSCGETPASGNVQFKSTNKSATQNLIALSSGLVKTAGGTTLGTVSDGNWLNLTVSFDMTTKSATYFLNGVVHATEALGANAPNISYFNISLGSGSGNAGASFYVDNLALSFGAVTADDTDYFEEAFPAGNPGGGEEPDGPADETVHALFHRDYEDGVVGQSYRTEVCSVAQDAETGNRFLKIEMNGLKDGYYHVDANETGNFLVDTTAEKNLYYFNATKLVIAMQISAGTDEIPSGILQIKSTGAAQSMATILSFAQASRELKSVGGTVLGTLTAGQWISVAAEIDLETKEVTYFIDEEQVCVETMDYASDKVSYFNISISLRPEDAGRELYFDDLYVGYGHLTKEFFMIPATFFQNGLSTVRYFDGETLTVPDDAPYWTVLTDNVMKLYAAGDTVPLTAGLVFSAMDLGFAMLDGASVRADYKTGIRFGTRMDRDAYDRLVSIFGRSNLTVGILIVPTDYLAETDFTREALTAKYPVIAEIINSRWYSSDDSFYYCYGTLDELRGENYARKFSAVSYLKIVYADGTEKVIYTVSDPDYHSRSVYEVAKMAYADTAAGYTEQMKTAIRGYLDGVLELTESDGAYAVASDLAGYASPYVLEGVTDGVATVRAVAGTDLAATLKSVIVNGTARYGWSVTDGALSLPVGE